MKKVGDFKIGDTVRFVNPLMPYSLDLLNQLFTVTEIDKYRIYTKQKRTGGSAYFDPNEVILVDTKILINQSNV